MSFWKASLIFVVGIFVFNVMFDAAASTGGIEGFIIGGFTLFVLFYVTGGPSNFKK
jgi:hypothetical protein